ncbi:MAG: amidohydrolase [Planctomycetaceae bacterium]|nr:amidohydrolase [Planctomycetaceae bacterium]
MANAWMVRTFIKHSDETEDFPELMGIVRGVFDTSLALESRINDPAAYFKMLSKKLGKLEVAARQFAIDAPIASTHTNFKQAVISIRFCCQELRAALETYQQAPPSSSGSR